MATRLRAELPRGDVASSLAVRGWVWQLAATVMRARVPSDAVPAWLAAVSTHIEQRWDEPVTLAELAHQAGVHPSHLTRRFRTVDGMSPSTRCGDDGWTSRAAC